MGRQKPQCTQSAIRSRAGGRSASQAVPAPWAAGVEVAALTGRPRTGRGCRCASGSKRALQAAHQLQLGTGRRGPRGRARRGPRAGRPAPRRGWDAVAPRMRFHRRDGSGLLSGGQGEPEQPQRAAPGQARAVVARALDRGGRLRAHAGHAHHGLVAAPPAARRAARPTAARRPRADRPPGRPGSAARQRHAGTAPRRAEPCARASTAPRPRLPGHVQAPQLQRRGEPALRRPGPGPRDRPSGPRRWRSAPGAGAGARSPR